MKQMSIAEQKVFGGGLDYYWRCSVNGYLSSRFG